VKAQNLTISVPGDKCDKNCGYCISTITWQPENDMSLMASNVRKVKEFASKLKVPSVLFTGKKEPFLAMDEMLWLIRRFKDYWVEVQTNGILLNKHPEEFAMKLMKFKVNVVAFSIDRLEDITKYEDTFATLTKFGIIVRVCFNLTKEITAKHGFYSIMSEVIKRKDKSGVPFIRQVLFRNISYPSTAAKNHPTVKWIDNNVSQVDYLSILDQAMRANMKVIRTVSYTGIVIYSYNRLSSVCFSDYCLQETSKTEDIRSLIFHSDGHVYTSWDDPTSVLF